MATLQSPTLGKLILNVRNLLGQPNPVNSTWTDAELKEYINEAVRIYFADVVKNMEGYFTVTTDPNNNLSYVANQETVALPSDCFQVKALYIQRSNGWEILEYRNDVTNGFLTNTGSGGSNTYSPMYYFMGNNLVLHPTPNLDGANQLRLDYIQMPDQMINGGDTMTNQVSPVFKQLIEMYAVYKAKIKQSMVVGTDLTAIAKDNLEQIAKNFKDTITPRSAYPEFVVPYNPEGYWVMFPFLLSKHALLTGNPELLQNILNHVKHLCNLF